MFEIYLGQIFEILLDQTRFYDRVVITKITSNTTTPGASLATRRLTVRWGTWWLALWLDKELELLRLFPSRSHNDDDDGVDDVDEDDDNVEEDEARTVTWQWLRLTGGGQPSILRDVFKSWTSAPVKSALSHCSFYSICSLQSVKVHQGQGSYLIMMILCRASFINNSRSDW